MPSQHLAVAEETRGMYVVVYPGMYSDLGL